MNIAQALLGYTLSDLKHVCQSILFHPKIKSTMLDNDSEVKTTHSANSWETLKAECV